MKQLIIILSIVWASILPLCADDIAASRQIASQILGTEVIKLSSNHIWLPDKSITRGGSNMFVNLTTEGLWHAGAATRNPRMPSLGLRIPYAAYESGQDAKSVAGYALTRAREMYETLAPFDGPSFHGFAQVTEGKLKGMMGSLVENVEGATLNRFIYHKVPDNIRILAFDSWFNLMDGMMDRGFIPTDMHGGNTVVHITGSPGNYAARARIVDTEVVAIANPRPKGYLTFHTGTSFMEDVVNAEKLVTTPTARRVTAKYLRISNAVQRLILRR